MIMTMQDKLIYESSTLCHICNEKLGEDTVRDHCLVSLEVLLMKSATYNTRFQSFSQLYFTISRAMIVIYLLKQWEIAKEIFIVYQTMKETTFLLRNRSSLINLLIRGGE